MDDFEDSEFKIGGKNYELTDLPICFLIEEK